MSWRQLELIRDFVSEKLESGVVVHRLSPNFEEVGASRQRGSSKWSKLRGKSKNNLVYVRLCLREK